MLNDKSNSDFIEIFPLGDSAVVVQLGDQIDLKTHKKVSLLSKYLDNHPFPGMIEYIPAFTTVTVLYDPLRVYQQKESLAESPYELVYQKIRHFLANLEDEIEIQAKIVEIPVCYGGDFGPDLWYVAEYNNLTPEEVIKIHSNNDYLVYMIGFAPGFPYLGGMPKQIATPRRPSPRLSIPAGSIGIAGEQTGAYPIETPGGWQLIGRTPLALFCPNALPPSLLQAGDIVKFRPISSQEYQALGGKLNE